MSQPPILRSKPHTKMKKVTENQKRKAKEKQSNKLKKNHSEKVIMHFCSCQVDKTILWLSLEVAFSSYVRFMSSLAPKRLLWAKAPNLIG